MRAFTAAMCSLACHMLITFKEVSSRVAPAHVLGTSSVLSWSLSFTVGPCSAARMSCPALRSAMPHLQGTSTPTQQAVHIPLADSNHTSQLSLSFQAPPICTQVSVLPAQACHSLTSITSRSFLSLSFKQRTSSVPLHTSGVCEHRPGRQGSYSTGLAVPLTSLLPSQPSGHPVSLAAPRAGASF